jgi:TRAP-type uncharacterized transport system substrate-binding protein
MYPRGFIYAALIPAILGFTFLIVQVWSMPTTLRVGVTVAGGGGENLRIITAFSQILAREKASIRLKVVSYDTSALSSAALDSGKVDLTVSRADVAVPSRGQTLAILHDDPVIILATARSGITRITQFKGIGIGVPPGLGGNQTILNELLRYYDVPMDSVRIETVAPKDLAGRVRAGAIDVAFLVQAIGSRVLSEAYNDMASEGGGVPRVITVPEAKAISQLNPTIQNQEVLQGSLRGNPAVPAETMDSISVSHRLFASRDLSDATVAELTRLLFVYKPAITAEVPLASRIEAPDTEKKGTVLPVHPGAAAYYDGDVKTFIESYGDWLYFGALVLGLGGSGMAAAISRASMRSRERAMGLLDDLLALLNKARVAESKTTLDDIEHQADEIFSATIERASDQRLDAAAISAFAMAFEQVRKAIDDRRQIFGTPFQPENR